MKKLLIATLAVATLCGCQTRITATKNAENIHPTYSVATINGTNSLIVTGYLVTSGGWEATARSPLWATESLKGLDIGVATNGTVTLKLDAYNRDLSTNAVVITEKMLDAAVNLTEKVTSAIITAGGSTATTSTQTAIATLVSKFISSGGDTNNATVTCKDGSCTISDGTTTCTDGSCYETSSTSDSSTTSDSSK